jgi:Carboxypeptidase regulatory-like domain
MLGVVLFSVSLFAQGTQGRISGTVTDQTGAVIPGATVTVTDMQRGIPRNLTTDRSGEYVAPSLLPGTYTVRAEAKGFKAIENSNLLLEVGKDIRVDLTLQPGEQTQTVNVTGEAPAVETTNATLGGTLSNETINELPMMGRSYQNLLVLRPGMMIYPGGGGWTMSTNGSRPEENSFVLEGLTNDNPLQGLTIINGPGVAGDAATVMPLDAIQELNIQENPPAEYGGKNGAFVNVGIKSGTNSFHGTAYAFGRDSSMDARNYFNPPPQPQRPVNLEQFGGTVGGPILKDKLFFFAGYEGERYSIGNFFVANVPETGAQAAPDPRNSLADAISGLISNGLQPSALSLKLTGCAVAPAIRCSGGLYPTNNTTSKTFNQGFPSEFGSDNGVLKIDYHINDRHSLSGTYFQSEGVITAEDVVYLQQQWRSVQDNRPRVTGINWTWVPNSRWVNTARFGYVLMNRESLQVDSSLPATTYGINTGVTTVGSLPIIRVGGFNQLGGSPGWPYRFGPDSVFQFVDYVSFVAGNHAFKFGGDFRRNYANPSQRGAAKGAINFFGGQAFPGSTPLEDMLAGVPTNATIQSGDPGRELLQYAYAASFQDDWRIIPTLTVNLGLRYEYTTPMSEVNNLLGSFSPSAGLQQVGSQIGSIYQGNHHDFAPRLGLAWDLSGHKTTVLRAGYNIIYSSMIPMQAFTGIGGGQNGSNGGVATVPTGATIVVNGVSTKGTGTIAVANVTLPGGVGSPLSSNWQNNGPKQPIFSGANTVECGDGSNDAAGNATSPCNVSFVDPHFKDPYLQNWHVGIQHAFAPTLTLDVSYVGSHGSRLNGLRDINQGVPILDSPSAAPGPYAAKFPYLGFINEMSNLYISNYHGLQTTVTQRTAHGLSFLASYTYSHSLDGDSVNIGQYLPQNNLNPSAEYATSDFDIRHRFTFSATYRLPGKKSVTQLLEGWEINSVLTLQTGQPWYGNDTVDNISGTNEFADRWNFSGDPHDFKSGNSSIPYCSGSDFSQPGTVTCSQLTPASANPVLLSAAQTGAAVHACFSAANAINASTVASLNSFGCYFQGHSLLIPPALGTFGTSGRNAFPASGLSNLDLSITKSFKYREALTAQFRAEFFNVFNHPNFTNPYGSSNGFGAGIYGDPSSTVMGCGCATPDQAAGNPVLGSGGNRAIQLGLKLIF